VSDDQLTDKDEQLEKLLELSRQAKGFKYLSIILAVIALGICLVIYNQQADGNILKLAEKPLLLLYMFFPFVPALVLARLYFSKSQKFRNELGKSGIDISSLR
jgi:hypothetical protein